MDGPEIGDRDEIIRLGNKYTDMWCFLLSICPAARGV